VPSRPPATSQSRQFWADCTISMAGSEFPTGTMPCSIRAANPRWSIGCEHEPTSPGSTWQPGLFY
jgi:hypothetical protein